MHLAHPANRNNPSLRRAPFPVTLHRLQVKDNIAAIGGGLCVKYSSLTMGESELRDNLAWSLGGGVYSTGATQGCHTRVPHKGAPQGCPTSPHACPYLCPCA